MENIRIPLLYVFSHLKPHHIMQIACDDIVPKKSFEYKLYEKATSKIIKESKLNAAKNFRAVNICEIVNKGVPHELIKTKDQNKLLTAFLRNLPKYSATVINKEIVLVRDNKTIAESKEFYSLFL